MVALGLLLMLVAVAAGALAAWLAARSSTGVVLEGAGLSVMVAPLTLLVVGAAVLVLLWLGWRILVAGARRRRAEREELRQLRSRTNQTGSSTLAGRGNAAGSGATAGTSAGRSEPAGHRDTTISPRLSGDTPGSASGEASSRATSTPPSGDPQR